MAPGSSFGQVDLARTPSVLVLKLLTTKRLDYEEDQLGDFSFHAHLVEWVESKHSKGLL